MNDPEMNDPGSHQIGGNETDLEWLAERFVLGDLPLTVEEAMISRLSDDDALALAVARASRLVVAVRTDVRTDRLAARATGSQPRPRPHRVSWQAHWPLVAAATLTMAVALVAWVTPSPRPGGSPAHPGSTTVAEVWRKSAEPPWAVEDPTSDDEAGIEPDAVPGWLLAALSLDMTPAGDPEVLEN
jgi:hypothetical protein